MRYAKPKINISIKTEDINEIIEILTELYPMIKTNDLKSSIGDNGLRNAITANNKRVLIECFIRDMREQVLHKKLDLKREIENNQKILNSF